MVFDIYHSTEKINEHCLPGQEYFLAGQVEASDLYSAYLRSVLINSHRQTSKGDIILDILSNQCYLVMIRGFYPVNLNWIQPKTV